MSEPRPLILNAFTMSAVSHLNYGLWRHPDDQSWRYNDLGHWTGLARTLEQQYNVQFPGRNDKHLKTLRKELGENSIKGLLGKVRG